MICQDMFLLTWQKQAYIEKRESKLFEKSFSTQVLTKSKQLTIALDLGDKPEIDATTTLPLKS